MSEPTVRLRRQPDPRYGMTDRCWVNWLLAILIIALLFVTAANTILLYKLVDRTKVVRVSEQVIQ